MRRWQQQADPVWWGFNWGQVAQNTDGWQGYGIHYPVRHGQVENWVYPKPTYMAEDKLTFPGPHGTFLVQLNLQIPPCRTRGPLLPPHRTRTALCLALFTPPKVH